MTVIGDGALEYDLSTYSAHLFLIPNTNIQLCAATPMLTSDTSILGPNIKVDDTTTYGPWLPKVVFTSDSTRPIGGTGMWVRFKFYSRSDT
jgi:hypothetical protein